MLLPKIRSLIEALTHAQADPCRSLQGPADPIDVVMKDPLFVDLMRSFSVGKPCISTFRNKVKLTQDLLKAKN